MAFAGYRYQRLNDASKQIRLFYLDPESRNVNLTGTIKIVRLQSAPVFETLSYAWGQPELISSISIDGRRPLGITANLEEALHRLRLPDRSRTLWIDAICINQDNVEERNFQVRLMHSIFSSSVRTIAFLGSEAGHSAMIPEVNMRFGAISPDLTHQDVEDASEYSIVGIPDPGDQSWQALTAFFSRAWFRRVWVFQEAIVSKQVLITCGNWSCPLETLAPLLKLVKLGIAGHLVNQRYGEERSSELEFSYQANFSGNEARSALTLFQAMLHHRQRREELRLGNTLLECRHTAATDPRDHVYALLGLCFEREIDMLQPDYSQSLATAYARYTIYMFEEEANGTELLGLAGLAFNRLNVPSWVVDWSSVKSTQNALMFDWRFGLSALLKSMRYYSASGSTTAVFSVSSDLRVLHIRGFEVDRVAKLATYHEVGNTFQHIDMWMVEADCLINSVCLIPQGQTQREVQARTLVANRALDSDYPYRLPADLMDSFRCFWVEFRHGFNLDDIDADLPHTKSEVFENMRQHFEQSHQELLSKFGAEKWLEYFDIVKHYWKRRRLALTTSGNLALLPLVAREDDIICILFGSRVAHVLRKADDLHWQLIGDCYLHGMMDGEAMKLERIERSFSLI